MASLLALLAQQGSAQSLQTRKGLLILGVQNDFISPEGKLPISDTSFVDRIAKVVEDFRDHGEVIWAQTVVEPEQSSGTVSSEDTVIIDQGSRSSSAESGASSTLKANKRPKPNAQATPAQPDAELYLNTAPAAARCCLRDSVGVEWADGLRCLRAPRDTHIVQTQYSAFANTPLLMTLRSKLITQLFLVGCLTNIAVYATARDAARYGIDITLVEDCLGFRERNRHDFAIEQLSGFVGAKVITSAHVLDALNDAQPSDVSSGEFDDDEESEYESEDEDESTASDRPSSTDIRTLPFRPLLPSISSPATIEVDSDEDDDEEGETMLPTIVGLSQSLQRQRALRNAVEAKVTRSSVLAAGALPRPRPRDPTRTPEHRDHATQKTSRDRGVRTQASSRVDGLGAPLPRSGGVMRNEDVSKKRSENEGRAAGSGQNKVKRDSEAFSQSVASGAAEKTESDPNTAEIDALSASLQSKAILHEPQSKPLFGREYTSASQSSQIAFNLLPEPLSSNSFKLVNNEVSWSKMYHQAGEVPRLVCCQGSVSTDGSTPVYRHPSDRTLLVSPWTPTVDKIRLAAERVVGHTLNHALIQLYRHGGDYISEHSDKTLDIASDSFIVNVSLGAQRTMRLRTKRAPPSLPSSTSSAESLRRTTHRVPLPHNSMVSMSLSTNARYLHGIKADKRPACELSSEEKAFEGQRISITFRHIATFLAGDGKRIYGQGAKKKVSQEAGAILDGDEIESEKLIQAFGKENADSEMNWKEWYGEGSDVLHLKKSAI